MKIYNFSSLSKKAQDFACLEYIASLLEMHRADNISISDARRVLLKNTDVYTEAGFLIEQEKFERMEDNYLENEGE